MCGVVGAVALTPCAPLEAELFERLVDTMAHRGPDGRGSLHGKGWALGHRRLSVIDPNPRSAQPLSDAAGRVHITFNGEIFNYEGLREELCELGHRFRTGSDTEVVVEAYKAWGEDALDRLRGMFAFGIYDERVDRLLLARDRLGIKPLLYARIGPRLVFASELRTLAAFPGFERRLDPQAVSAFLSFRQPIGRRTFLAGAWMLEPGELLRVEGGDVSRRTWWRLRAPKRTRMPRPLRRRRLRRALTDAVDLARVSDVPVGALLSGGLDSSAIALDLAAGATGPLECFTVRMPSPDLDETSSAELVARAIGGRHHVVAVSEHDHLIQQLRALAAARDQPLGLHNEVALALLARAAARHVRVVLSGEGADELFSGYARIFRLPFEHLRNRAADHLPRPLATALRHRWGCAARPEPLFDEFYRRYTYFPEVEKLALLAPSMLAAVDHDRPLREYMRSLFDEEAGSATQRIERVFLRFHLRGLLQAVDAMSMQSGLELRVPFLDHRLVEMAMALPRRDKLRWRSPVAFIRALFRPVAAFSEEQDESKVLLRRVYRDRLPGEVLRRRKVPFLVPLDSWTQGALGRQARELLLAPKSRSRHLFDVEALETWIDAAISGQTPRAGRRLWMLLNLELWLQAWLPDGPLVIHPSAANADCTRATPTSSSLSLSA